MESDKIKETKRKLVELFAELKLRNIFPGEWESIYKGAGVEFADIKPFELGDDLQTVDPRTLGLKEEMRVIQRMTEKQLKVYTWADFSASLQEFEEMFFSRKTEIRDIAIGLILFSAAKAYSPVGFYPFGLKEKKVFPVKTGEGYCWEIINWIAESKEAKNFTSSGVESALASLFQYAHPRNMVFFVSDFKQRAFEEDFTELLRPVVSKFDFIPVVIRDPLEEKGEIGRPIRIQTKSSSVGGKGKEVYLTPNLLRGIQEVSREHLVHLQKNFRRVGIECIVLDSDSVDECCRSFHRFFQLRRKTRK